MQTFSHFWTTLRKYSNVVRPVRSASSQNFPSCPNDSQSNDVCIHFGSGGGGTRKDFVTGMCQCDVEKNPKNEEMCDEGCKILGFDCGFVPSDDKLDCECNPCRKTRN